MNELIAMLVPVLGRALLHFVWQGLAIGLVAAMLLHALRGARAQLRYAVGCLALLACVLLPLTGVVVLGLDAIAAESSLAPASGHALMVIDATAAVSVAHGSAWQRIDAAMPLLVALWAAGASIFCLRMGVGALWLRRLRASAGDAGQPMWQARLDALAARFSLHNVSLRLVSTLDSPVAAGWLRPVVLLPAAVATRMPVELVEALLAHELAHIRRHDYLVNLLQNLVEALLFYHPVVWWLSHRVRAEREHIADAMAAEAIGDPRRVARALSALSELSPAPRALPRLAPAAHGGPLVSRIQELVRPDQPRLRAGRIALPVIGVAAACIAFIAQAQIDKPHKETKTAPAATTTVEASHVRHAAEAAEAEAHAASAAASHARAQAGAAPHGRMHGFARIDGDMTHEAFAIVRRGTDDMVMSGSTRDTNAIEDASARLDSDFLWFRRGDQAYVVVDPSLVARAEAAWRDSNALGSQMEALGREMEGHGAKMATLGGQMDGLAGAHRPSPAMRQAQERLQVLAGEQQQLAGQQLKLARQMRKADDVERESLEAKSERLSEEMAAVGTQMEQQGKVLEAEAAQLERNRAPMEALGRQMEAASKPMEALGARMEVLGKQQEALVRKAERDTNDLITEALRKGLAKPAPGSPRTQ